MLTFTYSGGTTVSVKNGTKTLVVHAEKGTKPTDDTIVLLGNPEEEPGKGTISWPGEYDLAGIAIRGIGHEEGAHVSYAITVNGVRCAFLHSPLHDWNDDELELLGDVDVLCIPSDDPKIIQKLVDEIDPRVLIPLDTGGAEKHAEALKVCDAQDKEPVEKYDLKGALPAEGREVVVLKAKK